MGEPQHRRPGQSASAFKVLAVLGLLYGFMSLVVYKVMYMSHVRPLGPDAPLDRFSEARAIEHIRALSVDIPGRQEGSQGLERAARYIKSELQAFAARAGSGLKIEIEEMPVNGSFSMLFLRHQVTVDYKNHKNIIMRISSNFSEDHETSFLVNGHFDSPLGSPGAGDCGSCVASMLELARLMVDSNWIPPKPIIFLFNGAEELFLLGAHGFVTTHRWSNTIGAFINIEASGTGGFDLVCQSGPGSWPTHIYASSVKYPMANSVAQDFFGVIPGDTDYRIFAEDHGNVPGLDIIFVIGGYFYHTSYDTVDKLIPGSIQARGDNLIGLVKSFVHSPFLLNAAERSKKIAANGKTDERAVFFDFLTFFMVLYSRNVSFILHSLPIAIYLLAPLYLVQQSLTISSLFVVYRNLIADTFAHAIVIVLGVIVPVLVAVSRLLLSKHAMNWFAHPYLSFLMFVPSSLIGILLPRTIWARTDDTCFWGPFGLYALITAVYMLSGLSGGFLTFSISASMLLGWICFCRCRKYWGNQSLISLLGYIIPQVPCLLYCVYYGGFLIQFLIEKMGMMGALPDPYGFFVPDVVVAAVSGIVIGWCFSPVMPVAGRWLCRTSVLKFLAHVTVVALALSSQFFPYSVDAPKRVVFQHRFFTEGTDSITESSYDFSVVDANSLAFVFNNAPQASKWLQDNSELSFDSKFHSDRSSWVALYPVPFLFSGSLKFPAKSNKIMEHYAVLPHLDVDETVSIVDNGNRRVHVRLHLGSLSEIWVSVLNITGSLSNWSFAGGILPVPQRVEGGPPSYICRLSGSGHDDSTFWLEANSSKALRVDFAVLDQYLTEDSMELKNLFPGWADVTAFSTFFSTYQF